MGSHFTAVLCLATLIAIGLPFGQGYKCYDEACTGTPNSRPCRTDADEFGPAYKKLNCPTGCKYWTIKDESGRPIANQPFKVRSCWDSYYDGGDKYKDGTCTVQRSEGRVDRVCVCASDWCNDPDFDSEFDAMSSSPSQLNTNLMGSLTISVLGIALAKIVGQAF